MTVTLEVANPAVLALLRDMECLNLVQVKGKQEESAGTTGLKQSDSSRIYVGCLQGKNIFKGDPVAIQRKMRDGYQCGDYAAG